MKSKFLSPLHSTRTLSFIEQSLISGTTFLSMLFFARVLSKDAWGIFSITIALFHFSQGFQRALITIPMITFSPGESASKANFRFWLREMHRLTMKALLLCAVIILIGSYFFTEHWINSAFAGLLIVLAPHFYYEFVRRVLIQIGQSTSLVFLSWIYAGVTALAVILVTLIEPSSWAAAVAYASGALIASVVGLFIVRQSILSDENQFVLHDRPHLTEFSKWALFSHFAFSSYVIAIPIILGFAASPAAVAVLTAIRNLVQPLNTLLAAIDNADKPKASREWAERQYQGLFDSLAQTRQILILIGGCYLLFAALFGAPVLNFLYAGKYDGNAAVLFLWLAIYAAMLLSQPSETGLFILRKPAQLFKARAVSALLGLTVAAAAIPMWSASGAALALFVGWATNAITTHYFLSRERTQGER